MSAEILRRAASLMRERAEAAIKDSDGDGVWSVSYLRHVTSDGHGYEIADCESETDAEHIASWHPAVALAVADWLDATVAAHDGPDCYDPHGLCPEAHAALDLARVYLGETA